VLFFLYCLSIRGLLFRFQATSRVSPWLEELCWPRCVSKDYTETTPFWTPSLSWLAACIRLGCTGSWTAPLQWSTTCRRGTEALRQVATATSLPRFRPATRCAVWRDGVRMRSLGGPRTWGSPSWGHRAGHPLGSSEWSAPPAPEGPDPWGRNTAWISQQA